MDVKLSLIHAAAPETSAPSAKSADAARQFESLLLGQLLRASHGEGWLGSGEDSTAAQANAIADEFLAQALAARGGIGIARMLEKEL